MAAAWRIISPRQKTIRKGARYCLPAVAVIGLMSWVNISLSSSPRTCICASDVERQKQVANAARLFPISVAESQWKSLQSNTTKKKREQKASFPNKTTKKIIQAQNNTNHDGNLCTILLSSCSGLIRTF